MKKIILFGATGNVGSYMVKYMADYFRGTEYQVVASGRRETKVFDSFGVPYVSVDITNEDDFQKLPQEDVFAVVDLAAVIPSYMKEYHSDRYLQTNIMGTYHILEYCRKVHADRILFSTTVFDISLYEKNGAILKDDLPLNFSYKGDHAVYVISKNSAIELMKHYQAEYGLKGFVFRFPTIYAYSPFHYYYPNGQKTLRPIYRFIDAASKGEPLELWGDPDYATDMVHVYDCSQMFCKAIQSDLNGGLYNVGTGMPVTLQHKFEAIIKVFSPQGHPSKIIYRPEKKNSGGFLMDISKAKQELGYEPVYTIEKLLEDYKQEMALNRFAELRLPKA